MIFRSKRFSDCFLWQTQLIDTELYLPFADFSYVQSTAKNARAARSITKEGFAVGADEEKTFATGRRSTRKVSGAGELIPLLLSVAQVQLNHFYLKSERDEAICRVKRTAKQAEKACHQLVEAKAQIAELKAQLVDAAEHKIVALERARKIDELQARISEVENEKSRLIAQLTNFKARCRSAIDSSTEKTRRDEHIINVCISLEHRTLNCEILIAINGLYFTV